MALGGCYNCLKFMVVVINLIILLCGIAIISSALFFMSDQDYYYNYIYTLTNANTVLIGLYVILAVGIVTFLSGFLGCTGAFRNSQCLLVTFFCFMLIILVAEIAAGAWGYTHKGNQLGHLVEEELKTTVKQKYGADQKEFETMKFDELQAMFECCGASGPTDWSDSLYSKGKGTAELSIRSNGVYNIPISCCNRSVPNAKCAQDTAVKVAATVPDTIFQEGCYKKFVEFAKEHEIYILIGFVSYIGLQVFALILSMILCCAIRAIENYKA